MSFQFAALIVALTLTTALSVNGQASCGGEINGTDGFITSPGYPQSYIGHQFCQWMIRAPQGKRVQFTWLDFNVDCLGDFLQIWSLDDGLLNQSKRYCGATNPDSYVPSGGEVMVIFRSDAFVEYRGFKMRFEMIDDSGSADPMQQASTCGGLHLLGSQAQEIITSPGYPQEYQNNILCLWLIRGVPADKLIKISFSAFDLQPDATCQHDFLAMVTDLSQFSDLSQRMCGASIPSVKLFSGPDVFMAFMAERNQNSKGFSLAIIPKSKVSSSLQVGLSSRANGTWEFQKDGILGYPEDQQFIEASQAKDVSVKLSVEPALPEDCEMTCVMNMTVECEVNSQTKQHEFQYDDCDLYSVFIDQKAQIDGDFQLTTLQCTDDVADTVNIFVTTDKTSSTGFVNLPGFEP